MNAFNERSVSRCSPLKTKQMTTLEVAWQQTLRFTTAADSERTASCVTHTTSSVKVDWEKKETAPHLSNPPLSDYCRLHHSDNDLKFGTALWLFDQQTPMIRLGISGGYVTKLLSKPHPYFAGINCNCTGSHYIYHVVLYILRKTRWLYSPTVINCPPF